MALAVLPTPVGPANKRVEMGLAGLFSPALKTLDDGGHSVEGSGLADDAVGEKPVEFIGVEGAGRREETIRVNRFAERIA